MADAQYDAHIRVCVDNQKKGMSKFSYYVKSAMVALFWHGRGGKFKGVS